VYELTFALPSIEPFFQLKIPILFCQWTPHHPLSVTLDLHTAILIQSLSMRFMKSGFPSYAYFSLPIDLTPFPSFTYPKKRGFSLLGTSFLLEFPYVFFFLATRHACGDVFLRLLKKLVADFLSFIFLTPPSRVSSTFFPIMPWLRVGTVPARLICTIIVPLSPGSLSFSDEPWIFEQRSSFRDKILFLNGLFKREARIPSLSFFSFVLPLSDMRSLRGALLHAYFVSSLLEVLIERLCSFLHPDLSRPRKKCHFPLPPHGNVDIFQKWGGIPLFPNPVLH